MKRTVCLNMIVKDEAPVIRRCLESVRPLVDSWVIVDTGSTDGTQDVIRDVYRDLPGELHERPWRGFDGSRTEAIELARDRADYLLFVDADDAMAVDPDFRMPELTLDAYRVDVSSGPARYRRRALVSTRLPWRYVGVLHEYLDCAAPYSVGTLEGPTLVILGGGGRGRGKSRREKYLGDAEILRRGLTEEPDNARYVFYLAQSLRFADEPEQAIEAYDRRAGMGGWDEEVYCARLFAARLAEGLGRPPAEVMGRYLGAHESRPARAEALGELARWCRLNGERWPLAYLFARQAARLPYPGDDHLFVEPAWYEWQTLDELAVAAFWVGEYEESKACAERLLARGTLPDAHRERVLCNLGLARSRLPAEELVGT
ncbi:glycosyltransferase [Streptomyces echinatus]|uniref:Tetratricopeptide (TPR) repeat protein n=1 Tax=Streptomyces echinatus TaxID=67293 RepID=A0A7W9PTA9_9ACTN|nr:glycosyltransferase [Streptomyces echinatus]MBB5927593.1 tetratricopeptide (TPR) repeat protein [Streptomyces echinatus]